MTDSPLYTCPECGLHYEDQQIADACAAFCAAHHSCSLDITQHAIERTHPTPAA